MELLHTPGPWKARSYNGYDAYKSHVIFFGDAKKPNNDNYIAKVNWFPHDGLSKKEIITGQANAQLILHAPEMAQVLLGIRKRILDAGIPEGFGGEFLKITNVLSQALINWGE